MKKGLIVAATAVVLLGVSAAGYHAYARYDGWGHGRHHARMSTSDMAAYADARIAALRAGLALTPEQQGLWPPVETTLKELAQKHIERRDQFRAERAERRDRAERRERGERRDPVERLRRGAERLSERGADMKRLADAAEPLYQSLDEAQKRRFDRLARAGMRAELHQEDRQWRRGHHDGRGRHLERRGHGHDEHRQHRRERTHWDAAPQDAERL